MHHVALDRAGPDDRDFDDEVIEGLRLHAGQHRHLGPALDLEDADGVRVADHLVGRLVFRRHRREVAFHPLVLCQKVEAPPHAAEHAEAEHVDFHELESVDVVLVPLDDLPVLHRGRLDRHEVVKAILGEHEAARVLR